jgi:hypothetical protein
MRKAVLFVFLASLAAAAASANTASADPCVKTPKTYTICIGEELILLASIFELTGNKAESTGSSFTILTTTPTVVRCELAALTAITEPSGTTLLFMKTKVVFTECEVPSDEVDCEVATGKISTESIEGSLSLAEETEGGKKVTRLDVKFVPESPATVFATFTIKSKAGHTCLGAQANGKVKGSELCYFLEPIEESQKEHSLQCVESELTFAGSAADLELTEALAGKEGLWDIEEAT